MESLVTYTVGMIILLLVFYLMCEIYFYSRQRYIERTLAPLIKEIYRGKNSEKVPIPDA